MLAEASLAILSTLAVATGMMVSGDDHVWHAVYEPIVAAKTLPEVPQALGGFVNGAATMLVALGLEGQVASTIVAVLVISFAATSLDTALRIQRLILGEIGEMFGWKALSNRWLAGTIACGSVLVLIYGDKAQGAKSLWPVFGATNQVFAAITLLLCALYLRGNKRSAWPYLAPAVVVILLTFSAMAVQVLHDIAHGQWLVGTAGAVIAILTGWVALEGAFAWRRAGRAGGDVTSRD
jgi:carbon starvation protein